MDPDEIRRSMRAEMEAIERCEKMVAPLRERAVLAEAVCDAVLESLGSQTYPPKVLQTLTRWKEAYPR